LSSSLYALSLHDALPISQSKLLLIIGMKKSERINFIIDTLEELYPNPPIPLNHKDAYTLLIAVLLSAQCTDERVNKITPALFSVADNPYDMVKLSVEKIADIIRPCGLSPMKSKGIYGSSKILIEKYDGQVPNSFSALEELPAVGHKTASRSEERRVGK